MALYIECDLEDVQRVFANCGRLRSFSAAALGAMLDWYDENDVKQELDVAELCGEWDEYDDAGAMWAEYSHLDSCLTEAYEPDMLDDLVDAIEARMGDVIRTESGSWLVHHP